METMTPQPASSFRPIPTESPQAQLDDLLTRICEALRLQGSLRIAGLGVGARSGGNVLITRESW
jgi:hypothetical protein